MKKSKTLSVLVPSRERADALKFSLDSLELKKNNLVEILVWIDDDDPQLEQYHNLFDNNSHIKMFIQPRAGYKNFHVMLNYLAMQASGDWMWLWNDDAYMENPDWYDTFISQASLARPKEEPVVYNLSPTRNCGNGFPVVSRKYLEILGHFAGSAACDLWVKRVVQGSRIQGTYIELGISGIDPTHRKYGFDPKLGDLIDTTYNYVESLRAKNRYFGGRTPSKLKAQHEDAKKILDWISQNKRK